MPDRAHRREPLSLPAPIAARGIVLRAERRADAAAVRALYGANRVWELALAPWPDAAKQRFLNDQFAAQTAHFAAHHAGADFMVLEHAGPVSAGGIIGRLYVDRRTDPWELLEIGLMPAEQARGLGTAIIEFLKDAAILAGAHGITLHVASDNGRAAALYRRLSFAEQPATVTTHRRMEWRAVGRREAQ